MFDFGKSGQGGGGYGNALNFTIIKVALNLHYRFFKT